MKRTIRDVRIAIAALALVLAVGGTRAQAASDDPFPIDLPTVLRLAGLQNLDLQIAREAVKEADANRVVAIEKFFPWLAVGAAYHRRDGFAQAVPAGTISNTHFYSYAPGGTVNAQVALGDAIYDALAAKQLVRASEMSLEAKNHDAGLAAAHGYFELAKADALRGVALQAVATSEDYQKQLHEAVAIGIAFKGDELRVQTQTELYEIAVSQAEEQARIAAARLAQTLHLDPTIALVPRDTGLVPLALVDPDAPAETLVQRALKDRPELAQSDASVAAAVDGENAAVYGPLIPSLGAQTFVGGLGGGRDGQAAHFGASQDYLFGLSWRFGTGGLFDVGRIDAASARATSARLNGKKLEDAVAAEVVESLTRVRSLKRQITLAERNLGSATDTLRLTRERKQYGVGIVLEEIQAQQALNQSRADYFTKIAEFNTAQFELNRAVGEPMEAREQHPDVPEGNPNP